ncbi:Protein of unknown function [Pyronema omphalodes CBS 100304]|uniref:Uncharacterized protein n=1 Tax=Pyronema omphalodes (strain CBS 100304) TaxID=1076935 RepID=U4LNF1_PYROM|nr:Protein of unknown function [Pyronema omphalodes CBS 100304]
MRRITKLDAKRAARRTWELPGNLSGNLGACTKDNPRKREPFFLAISSFPLEKPRKPRRDVSSTSSTPFICLTAPN